jgi:hypothetical protein
MTMPSHSRPLIFVDPMAATQVAELPRGPEWTYEIKLDGYRVLALKDRDQVRLLSRENKDLTRDSIGGERSRSGQGDTGDSRRRNRGGGRERRPAVSGPPAPIAHASGDSRTY